MTFSLTLSFWLLAVIAAAAVVNSQEIKEDEFMKAVTSNGYGRPSTGQYNNFKNGLKYGQISTKLEAAMALAQFLHESGGLKKVREGGCDGPNGCPGKYPDKNTYTNPMPCAKNGQSYYGRGYIQLSFCQNYRLASIALFGDGEKLRNNPDMVAQQEKLSWDVSFYFWAREVHPALSGSNAEKFGVSTDKINGPMECRGNGGAEGKRRAENRFKIFQRVFQAFNLSGRPVPDGCY